MSRAISVFLLDNFDSFTYNLVDELRGMGMELTIYRNSVSAQMIYSRMQEKSTDADVLLMLSPGPGEPSQAGCLLELIDLAKGEFPVLGICLGHQAIVKSYGGKVIRAESVMHGKASYIQHDNSALFSGLSNPLPVARYHSLVVSDIPASLNVIANFEGIPMCVYHPAHKMLGFQFHPESILTSHGSQLLEQSIRYLTQKA
ncbi:aminodeoxychorismate/anthranilate synthase component II [Aliiglaciecola lipolytica]|uniref:anthranilate synthase n=1 Tax=Aliiglaciecola lipolytica E3 TaxID=1127673 RepID=K6Y911_9ALTE|nr:aminodeoxychorismate/anthranilate synthase component II [Aliiglaciecola lipolytica]GAC14692.1 anthranilate synthase component II [Aliiglaciecola lipolytica E3]